MDTLAGFHGIACVLVQFLSNVLKSEHCASISNRSSKTTFVNRACFHHSNNGLVRCTDFHSKLVYILGHRNVNIIICQVEVTRSKLKEDKCSRAGI